MMLNFYKLDKISMVTESRRDQIEQLWGLTLILALKGYTEK